ncbi:MAG: DUF952 domain-containing protein [Aureliella sp.]
MQQNTERPPRRIYKVLGREPWNSACIEGVFEGAAIDLQDGFIHFSSREQVEETVRIHFVGQQNLVLVAFSEESFGDELRWEASRGGDLFPHLYAKLDPSLAIDVWELPSNSDGSHRFPDDY